MNEVFKPYRKVGVQMMRPYNPGDSLEGISVADGEIPEVGGMIAVDMTNMKDKWYVPKDFFDKNYEAAQ